MFFRKQVVQVWTGWEWGPVAEFPDSTIFLNTMFDHCYVIHNKALNSNINTKFWIKLLLKFQNQIWHMLWYDICYDMALLIIEIYKNIYNYTEQSPSWEANSRSAIQEIPQLSWNSNIHYRVHRKKYIGPIVNIVWNGFI
jgi:hypothetical protein